MKSKIKTGSHIIQYLGTQELLCLHCGYRLSLNAFLPASIDFTLGIYKLFKKAHRLCKKTQEGIDLDAWRLKHWETVKHLAEESNETT